MIRARDLTNSVGYSVVYNPNSYSWINSNFQIANWNELVVYEMHIGTFWVPDGSAPGTYTDTIAKLDHIKSLGVNCVDLLPMAEFPGDISWGYNPSYPFAVESAYGTPDDLKHFVDECHTRGIAVVNEVVFNHLGPNDMDMWKFDGWSQNNLGGIYFYNDTTRATTPWGNTRMDYSRAEVRQYIRDNAMMWLDEFRMDGLRWDGTKYMRRTDQYGVDIPEGWSLLQWCNDQIDAQFPGKIYIVEDFDDNDWVTKTTGAGGCGFDSQWDWVVHSIRGVIEATSDSSRSMATIRDDILQNYNGSHTQRVIYTESHDEVSNGKSRAPSAIRPAAPENWYARKRSTLGAAVIMFSPGIPMLFMGQEFLEDGYFDANDYANTLCVDVEANGNSYDGLSQSAVLNVGAYSFVVYSQDGAVQGNPADLDGICIVDSGDLGIQLLDIGGPGAGDLDGDGEVTSADVGLLLLETSWMCSSFECDIGNGAQCQAVQVWTTRTSPPCLFYFQTCKRWHIGLLQIFSHHAVGVETTWHGRRAANAALHPALRNVVRVAIEEIWNHFFF